jgi:hypothetical protein
LIEVSDEELTGSTSRQARPYLKLLDAARRLRAENGDVGEADGNVRDARLER